MKIMKVREEGTREGRVPGSARRVEGRHTVTE